MEGNPSRHSAEAQVWWLDPNFVVGVVLLLITPLLNGIMQHPRIAILSAAGGLTIIIWVVALAMMRSLPTAPKVDTTQTVTQQQSKSKQEENLKPVPNQAPLPKADSQRFVVALAHLEHDKNQEHERLIREVLKKFEGVQLLQFDRTISLEGTEPEESEKKGHAQAQQYLKDSGAHVLMWGLVLSHDRQSAPRLYWTTEQESRRAKEPYQPENFKLPELFWNDLQEVLRLVVATQYSTFLAQQGRFTADQLTPFITKVRQLIRTRADRQDWSIVQFILGNALSMLGEQIGTNTPLEEAVIAYQALLAVWTRERIPLDWAATQNNLGIALCTLGERVPGPARLEEAVTAYQAALTVWTWEHTPLNWAMAQNNLGNALRILGERVSGTARLEEAVTAYQAALTVWTRENVPQHWAGIQTNLGNALRGRASGSRTRPVWKRRSRPTRRPLPC